MSSEHYPGDPSPENYDYDAEHGQNDSKGCAGMALWIVLGIAALSLLLCCAGGFFLYSKFDFEVSEDPEAAVALTEEVVEIDIPAGFEPEGLVRMDMFVMALDLAIYEYAEAHGMLLVGEIDIVGSDYEDAREEMRESIEQSDVNEEDMRIVSTETREFEIRGETARFEFTEAESTETGEPFRQVIGAFPGKNRSFAMVWYQLHEDYYDEAAAIRMIESIE